MFDFYYTELDLRYPEEAILLEDTVDENDVIITNIGKLYIPILMPLLNKNSPYETLERYIPTKNILSNTTNLDIRQCITSNYVEADMNGFGGRAGDKFTIVFIGGDINKIKVISKGGA